jgi:heme-degrading monooxygenase HmoA
MQPSPNLSAARYSLNLILDKQKMYAVIFKAEINELDQSYSETASRMQELAISKYSCTEFTSVTEGGQEISVSYWNSLEDIKAWKQDPEHLSAQQAGRDIWYKSYRVQVVEILHDYNNKR